MPDELWAELDWREAIEQERHDGPGYPFALLAAISAGMIAGPLTLAGLLWWWLT
jgi:hypothetical protein